MATSNGKKKTTAKGIREAAPLKADAPPTLPLVIDQNEVTGLKNRFETWQAEKAALRHHTLLEFMAHESYTQYAREVHEKYKLPDNYTVNYATGMVTATPNEEVRS